MRFLKQQGVFCRTCGIAVHREMTSKTLWQGWWGIASLVIAPATLLLNLVQRVRFGRMAPPTGGWRPPFDPGKPVVRRGAAFGILLPFAIVAAVATAAALDTSATAAEVGSCVRNNGTEAAPEVEVVDCSSPEAEFKVAERHDSSGARCDLERFAEYSESTGRRSGFTLCLAPVSAG